MDHVVRIVIEAHSEAPRDTRKHAPHTTEHVSGNGREKPVEVHLAAQVGEAWDEDA